jgi:hypothetical protein
MTDKEEKLPKDLFLYMSDQDGTDLLKYHWSKNNMIIQQICGVSVVFCLNYYSIFLKIMKLSTENFSKKDICFKEDHASLFLHVKQKKKKKIVKNKML